MSDASMNSATNASPGPFAHLHCHTHYSLLDGANRIDQVVKKIKGAGMDSLAITDHGNLYGALEFYNECRGANVNPILGLEAYIAPGSRFDKSGASRVKEACYHLTLLSMNAVGFQNLVKLSSAAFLEGFYHRPRIDKEILEQHSEGLILLSGCAAGELSQLLLGGRNEEAERLVAWYSKVFGDRLYMEIQNAGFAIQKQCMDMTVDLANRMGLPLVATNDAHYLNRTDAAMHDVLLCVNTKVERSDINRMKMDTDQLFVRTPEEMYDAFPGFDEAVRRSQEIANRVDIQLDLKSRHYPVFQPPEGKKDIDYLRELCYEGMIFRYGADGITSAHRERMDFELSVIEKMGYASYFLIVWDFVRFAVEQGIPCSARGSACGAIVAYVLRLSHVCPLEYDLLFERFLDPSRTEPPDIDIDFCRDRRQAVIDYTKQKYGSANVSQIGTFGTLKAKAAIRDVARVLSIPSKDVDLIAKMVPETLNITLDEAIKESAELQDLYNSDPKIREVLDLAKQIEGLARSAGTHAAGVVVSDRPISQYIPLQTITGKTDVITQWEGPTVEKMGLLKMDFLGLRNLTKNVKKHRGVDIDPVKLPLDDRETFALLQRGETKGIFQLESGGMRDLLTKMKPDKFADIIATSALYRPGPLEGGMVMTYVDVKHKRLPLPRLHPIIDAIVDETYGVMVYQEQVMRILNRLGGIDLPQSYQCIKAISKKKLETIAKYRAQFLEGASRNNLAQDKAVELFGMIEKFAGYGFNKRHRTAYGAGAYQTAYLKAHYPPEFMAALLSCELGETDKLVEHVDDCRRMGIPILPPDINVGDVEFSVLGHQLTFGLGAIKGVGEAAVAAIVAERAKNGPFKDLFALTERCDPKHVGKGVLELLVKAGACDCLGGRRSQQFAVIERAVQGAASIQRDKQRGQKNLFGGDEDEEVVSEGSGPSTLPEIPEWSKREMLAFEKEALGFFLTSHPLAEMSGTIKQFSTHSAKELVDAGENDNLMGVVRCIMWPEEFSRLGEKVEPEQVRFVRGKVDKRSREPNVIVDAMWTLEEVEKEFTKQVLIKFQKGLHDIRVLERVRDIVQKTPGKAEVILVVDTVDKGDIRRRYVAQKPLDQKISVNRDIRRELVETVGEENVKFVADLKKKSSGQSVGR